MMKKQAVFWNTLGSAMYGANSFVMLALVSRIGTVEQAGYFGIAFTTAQILYIVGLFGVNTYQMTDYGQKYRFSDYARVKAFSCALMWIGCAASMLVLRFTGAKAAYLLALTLLMMLNAIGELYQSLFFQHNRLDLSGSALFYRTLGSLAVFAAVLVVTRNILLSVACQTAANLALTLWYALRVAPSFIERTQNGAQTHAKALIAECLPLFVSMFVMNLVINASKYGIEFLMDDAAQGYYNMIFMPAQVINLCSQFLFKPCLNAYATCYTQRRNAELLGMLKRHLGWITLLILASCAAAAGLGAPVLGLLYAKDLSGLRAPITLVVLGGGVFAACQLAYYLLVVMRLQKYVMLIYLAGLAATVPLTAGLVGTLGLTGASLSFVATHLLILLCYGFVFFNALRRNAHA